MPRSKKHYIWDALQNGTEQSCCHIIFSLELYFHIWGNYRHWYWLEICASNYYLFTYAGCDMRSTPLILSHKTSERRNEGTSRYIHIDMQFWYVPTSLLHLRIIHAIDWACRRRYFHIITGRRILTRYLHISMTLFYLLALFRILMPPLASRGDDFSGGAPQNMIRIRTRWENYRIGYHCRFYDDAAFKYIRCTQQCTNMPWWVAFAIFWHYFDARADNTTFERRCHWSPRRRRCLFLGFK